MKKTIVSINGIACFGGLRRELTNSIDASQKPVQVMIEGYSNPDAIEIRLNGEPILINQDSTYTGNIDLWPTRAKTTC